jgi:phosphoadenosine phosphosulfate reductase
MALIEPEALAREVESARARGIDRDAREVIRWAHQVLGDGLMMTTAFGKSGMVILHMVRDIVPDLPIYFLDTSFHFPETMAFGEKLRDDWKVNLIFQKPAIYGEAFRAKYGENLYETDPDLCCHKNKVEPQRDLLERYQGWIAGVRKDQASTRANAEGIEVLEGGKLKVQPLAHWGRVQVEAYIKEHAIPLHPLFSSGYTSIGCAPCTQPSSDASNERAGRWMGKGKTECGLHTFWKKAGGSRSEGTAPAAGDAAPAPAQPPAGETARDDRPASGGAPDGASRIEAKTATGLLIDLGPLGALGPTASTLLAG